MTTVKRIYELALAKIFEAPGNDEDFDAYSPAILDALLLEALPYENQIRENAGRERLEIAPEIAAIDSTPLDWDDRICRVALPYGLASVLLSDDQSTMAQSVMLRNEFLAQLEQIAPAVCDMEVE